ncbi:Pseudouridine kinase [Pleomorphomonas sp. T1.2MG-36]|uniref:PfkB family carbohydrate kinase n=1 Tax=Pleomorphomonas sp. T1.2MG-36 TaxID=3041167 RepID=UPI002477C106|nr:PfkB family carbohydrate kinase [Pleomorphomonas sp. T1.2MG-36]CAI9402409.1 Pseudouridine kinase [Pleomorphomonas sp. T1.2MG-36]
MIGGCHQDVLGRAGVVYEPATSCPGIVTRRPGGVARNVAVLLGRAGAPCRFVSVVGDDSAGRELIAELALAEIDTGAMVVDGAGRTGTYLAIHDETGELVSAISDLGLYDGFILPPAAFGNDSALVFADANLAPAELRRLADTHGERLVMDAISRAKAPRLKPLVASGALFICNLPSAELLVGHPVSRPIEAAERLAKAGARRAVITGGSKPLAILDEGRITEIMPRPTEVVDVTGVGDAQTAGILLALAAGAPLFAAVEVGMAAARAALATAGALRSLPEDVVASAVATAGA